jgi:hypothetical protein
MPLWRRSELTESFLRPLARRELKTLRPLADAMRFRKPCLFRRLRTEGWKVLFISLRYNRKPCDGRQPEIGSAKIVTDFMRPNPST